MGGGNVAVTARRGGGSGLCEFVTDVDGLSGIVAGSARFGMLTKKTRRGGAGIGLDRSLERHAVHGVQAEVETAADLRVRCLP